MSRDATGRSRWGRVLVGLGLAVGLGLVGAAYWAVSWNASDRAAGDSAGLRGPSVAPPAGRRPVTADSARTSGQDTAFGASGPGAQGGKESDEPAGGDRDYEIAVRWDRVDLDAVREAMPDNLYWELGMPTADPDVEAERAEERRRWNEAFGKVLSGTASEAEIDAYYAQRYRLSTDYLEFANHLLANYGEVLPERDIGLLDLVVKMHHARLQQMPRRVAEAHERKQKQDRLREAWLADEAAFRESIGAAPAPGPESDPAP